MFDNIVPVSISERAAKEIRHIFETKNIPKDYGLRVGIKGAGCGGASMMLGFDKKKEGDVQYEIEGIPVFVEKKHTMYIIGKEIDFYEGSEARGFVFVDAKNEEK
jgi:iron-sulfur cluster assembly protein